MRVLAFYDANQTFTSTVFEHISSFGRHSKHDFFFCDSNQTSEVDLDCFDAVILHYSVRLPFDLVNDDLAAKLEAYCGLKVVFIQDEYDHTKRAWYWIKRLGISLVFTVVPASGIEKVYPPEEFPNTRFVNNLTGYVPEELPSTSVRLTSQRPLMVGYRGRSLPIQYGQLGFEKIGIGQLVKAYCSENGIVHDIAWDEKSRIYGVGWYRFMGSCRSMLGSESGSNVFDWDGTLYKEVSAYKKEHPKATEAQIYLDVVKVRELPGTMNQVSPRVFEAIALRTVLVLFRGSYSGVVVPDEHYIPLDKDGGNLAEVFEKLADGPYVDAMVERAYADVIASGNYAYAAFVRMVDAELEASRVSCVPHVGDEPHNAQDLHNPPASLSRMPKLYVAPKRSRLRVNLNSIWAKLPEGFRVVLRPIVRPFLRRK